MTKEYIAITNRCYTIPTKPSLKWLHNEPLSILPVPVRCPSPCLIRGGNNSVSWSCCTNACLPWPLSCLPHRLTQFIGSFIDYRQVFLSLCPPIFAFHTRKTILAMLPSTRLLTHCHKLYYHDCVNLAQIPSDTVPLANSVTQELDLSLLLLALAFA